MTDRIFSKDNLLLPGRRQLLLASFLAALPLGLSTRRAEAINPAETQVTLPDQIKWTAWTAGFEKPIRADHAALIAVYVYMDPLDHWLGRRRPPGRKDSPRTRGGRVVGAS